MKRLTNIVAIILLALAGCTKNYKPASSATLSIVPVSGQRLSGVADFNIVTTNQANDKIEVYDDAAANWNNASALSWSWKPTTALGYSSAEVAAWGDPDGVKRRVDASGNEWFAAVCSKGLATIASWPGGTKKWAKNVSGNPHDPEILPNGNIAIASSADATGPQHIVGSIRIYASSQGASGYDSCHVELEDAHGVLWDPALNRLWVLGRIHSTQQPILTTFIVGGTNAHPTLTEDATHRSVVPTDNGHCVSAFYGDTNKLWVSSGSHVYLYDKTTKYFANAPGGASGLDKDGVKGISNQPSGIVVVTRPDILKSSSLPEKSTVNTGWTTAYVDYYSNTGVYLSTNHRTGAAWYKGLVWWAHYQ